MTPFRKLNRRDFNRPLLISLPSRDLLGETFSFDRRTENAYPGATSGVLTRDIGRTFLFKISLGEGREEREVFPPSLPSIYVVILYDCDAARNLSRLSSPVAVRVLRLTIIVSATRSYYTRCNLLIAISRTKLLLLSGLFSALLCDISEVPSIPRYRKIVLVVLVSFGGSTIKSNSARQYILAYNHFITTLCVIEFDLSLINLNLKT